MNEENWKDEYKAWKLLKPSQVKLLENGAQSLSQSWLLNAMWCEWKDLKAEKEEALQGVMAMEKDYSKDPWED